MFPGQSWKQSRYSIAAQQTSYSMSGLYPSLQSVPGRGSIHWHLALRVLSKEPVVSGLLQYEFAAESKQTGL